MMPEYLPSYQPKVRTQGKNFQVPSKDARSNHFIRGREGDFWGCYIGAWGKSSRQGCQAIAQRRIKNKPFSYNNTKDWNAL